MTGDPIVEEVRKYRGEHAARFNYNIKSIVKDAVRRTKRSGRKTMSLATRRRSPKRLTK